MDTIKDEYETIEEAVEMVATHLGNYWTECDVIEKRDDPAMHIPNLVELHAEILCLEYGTGDKDMVKKELHSRAKRIYLEAITKSHA